ncbi:MAG: hypothetical protein QMD71_04145 [bacterium]|nr:hypothetical protein [bacterium]
MKKRENRGGYYFYRSKEQLKEYMALPPEQKLEWLEEINRFLYKAMPLENRKICEKFRRGEI